MRYLWLLFTFTLLFPIIGCLSPRRREANNRSQQESDLKTGTDKKRIEESEKPKQRDEEAEKRQEKKRKEKEAEERKLAEKGVTIQVKAFDLDTKYQQNSIAADDLYRGKIILIRGRIDDIGKDVWGKAFIEIGTSAGSLTHIYCMFEKAQESSLAKLKKDEFVAVIGRCEGKNLRRINIRKCSIHKKLKKKH